MSYFDVREADGPRAAFDELASGCDGVTTKTMFGCQSYQAEGTLFAVLVTEGVALIRLPGTDRERLADSFETGPFRAGDRTVTKWVQVPAGGETVAELEPYVRASYEAALAK